MRKINDIKKIILFICIGSMLCASVNVNAASNSRDDTIGIYDCKTTIKATGYEGKGEFYAACRQNVHSNLTASLGVHFYGTDHNELGRSSATKTVYNSLTISFELPETYQRCPILLGEVSSSFLGAVCTIGLTVN